MCIEVLIVVTLAVFVNADFTIQTPPASTYPNYSWNLLKMEHLPTANIHPIQSNFYHSTRPYDQFNQFHQSSNYAANNYNGYEKLVSIGMNDRAYITSGDYPNYSWPGKSAGASFQLPMRQLLAPALQQWPPSYKKLDKNYLPSGYVPLVSKIDTPDGYKLLANQYKK